MRRLPVAADFFPVSPNPIYRFTDASRCEVLAPCRYAAPTLLILEMIADLGAGLWGTSSPGAT